MIKNSIFILKEGWSKEKCEIVCNNEKLIFELEERECFRTGRMVFVGVISFYIDNEQIIIYCCPKYFDLNLDKPYSNTILNAVKEHMNLICRTFEQLRQEGKNIDYNDYQFSSYYNYYEKKTVNYYDLADFILNDYLRNGLFSIKYKEQKTINKGRVMWTKTVNKSNPIVERDEVIYTKLVNQYTSKNYSHTLTILHVFIINQCAKLLKPLGKYEDLILPDFNNEIDDLSIYYNYICSQLPYVYTNRDIVLLKALASWCSKSNFYKGIGGVTYFEKVWEYVTKDVWGNIDDTKSNNPTFYIHDKDSKVTEYLGKGEEIPDIIRILKIDDDICIGVFDAKYYYPWKIVKNSENEKGLIFGVPANSDIVKQVAYYRNIRQIYGDKLHYVNAFLMPEFSESICTKLNIDKINSSELYQYRGYMIYGVNHSIQDLLISHGYNIDDINKGEDIVIVYSVNPDALFKKYLSNNRKIHDDRIYENFIKKYKELTAR